MAHWLPVIIGVAIAFALSLVGAFQIRSKRQNRLR